MRYGKIDFDYALDLAGRAPENDGPIYMVNFMKYRDVAGYDGIKGAEKAAKPPSSSSSSPQRAWSHDSARTRRKKSPWSGSLRL
jgi:hypothetical protein